MSYPERMDGVQERADVDPAQKLLEEEEKKAFEQEYQAIQAGTLTKEDYAARRLAERRKARELSDHDPNLPTLLNRRRFYERVMEEIGEKAREFQDNTLQSLEGSLLMIDLDNFKPVNDRYGHRKGDEVLATLAATLHTNLKRPGDFQGRYGGEEFIVYLADTDLEGAIIVADRIRLAAQSGFNDQFPNLDWDKTVSIGIQSIPQLPRKEMIARLHTEDGRAGLIQALTEDADKGLYSAKHSGRNRIGLIIDDVPKIARIVTDPANSAQRIIEYHEMQS